jgi:hypothetical protein
LVDAGFKPILYVGGRPRLAPELFEQVRDRHDAEARGHRRQMLARVGGELAAVVVVVFVID